MKRGSPLAERHSGFHHLEGPCGGCQLRFQPLLGRLQAPTWLFLEIGGLLVGVLRIWTVGNPYMRNHRSTMTSQSHFVLSGPHIWIQHGTLQCRARHFRIIKVSTIAASIPLKPELKYKPPLNSQSSRPCNGNPQAGKGFGLTQVCSAPTLAGSKCRGIFRLAKLPTETLLKMDCSKHAAGLLACPPNPH